MEPLELAKTVVAYNSPSLKVLLDQADLQHAKIFVLTSTKYLVNVPLTGKYYDYYYYYYYYCYYVEEACRELEDFGCFLKILSV